MNLNVPVYLKVDRIDFRDAGDQSGLYVHDYKTGKGDANPYLLGEFGYLPQMIFYLWGAEELYGEPVKKVFLMLPGGYTQKWVEMNVHSLVEQSKVVEQVFHHLEHIRGCKETRHYETRLMRYCSSCQMKHMCNRWLESKGEGKNAGPEEIPVEIEVHDEYRDGEAVIRNEGESKE